MRVSFSFIGGAIAALSLWSSASAAPPIGCQLLIEPTPGTWAIRAYDPFAGGAAGGQFDVAFRNTGDKTCRGDVFVTLEGQPFGLATPGSGARLPYSVADDYDRRDVTPRLGQTAAPFNGQPFDIEAGEREIRRFTVVVDPERLTGDGRFEQTLYLALRERNGNLLATRPVQLSLEVKPSAVMGLKGAFERTGGGARVDLGELTSGPRDLAVALYVLSTRGYRVSIDSLNNGRLVRDGGQWSVPYSLVLGANAINLDGGFDVRSGVGLRDDTHAMSVVIGDVSQRRAGRYSDVLTMTVAPL